MAWFASRLRASCIARLSSVSVLALFLSAGPALAQAACPTAEELEVLDLINLERAAAGLDPVEMDVRLVESALRHADDMAQGCFLSHTGSDGSTAVSRMSDAGYPSPRNEAAGAGQTGTQQIVDDWMASSAHRAILLGASSVHVGIAHSVGPERCVLEPFGVYVQPHWWNADFGTAAEPAQLDCDTPVNSPPSVAILSPSSGETVSGNVTVSADASDDVGVSSVALHVDGALHSIDATAPYAFSWDTAGASDGLHTLEAVAVDSDGATGSSGLVGLDVANQAPPADASPPTVAITSPSDGSSVSKAVQIRVQASDDSALDRIDVAVDGARVGSVDCLGTSCSGSVSWNTRKAASGSHTVTAQAWDQAGRGSPMAVISVSKSAGTKGGGRKGRGKR